MPGSPKRVVVVGGGVVGLCVAYYSSLRGHEVTVLERGGPDRDCCSLGNAGMVVPSHVVPLASPGMVELGIRMLTNREGPFAILLRPDPELLRWAWLFWRSCTREHVDRSAPLMARLSLASRACFEEFSDLFDNCFDFTKKGLLMLCKSAHRHREEAQVAKLACDLGMPASVLSAQEAAALDPGIRMDIAGAVYYPLDCHLVPERFVSRLTQEVTAGGVDVLWNTQATGWRESGRRVEAVQTSQGDLSADEYVIAAGSLSAKIVRSLGIRMPLQAGKGYNITVPNPIQIPTICSICTDARLAVTPMGSALRFAGTMELGNDDSSIDEHRVRGILKSIPSYFPEFEATDLSTLPVWSGLRPCSPDGLPYVGRFNRYTNLSAATGHAMMGLNLAPITGKLIADVLSGDRTAIDIGALRPDRFA